MTQNRCWELLERDSVPISDQLRRQLCRFEALVREWTPVSGLVSHGDVDRLWEAHLADSLSLAGVIKRLERHETALLDIGTGGGFPAIPLRIVFPALKVRLVERSTRKVGFLRKAIGALGLEGVSIVHGEFPRAVGEIDEMLITARAVERQEQVALEVLKRLHPAQVFLYQGAVPLNCSAAVFHVEHVIDAWSDAGLRRGNLLVIQR